MSSSLTALFHYFLITGLSLIYADVSFAPYHGLPLPVPLFDHISVVYDEYVYIVGGYTAINEPSSAIYKSQYPLNATSQSTTNTFIHIGDIHLQSPSTDDPLTITSIICDNQCFTVIDHIMYILIPHERESSTDPPIQEDIILLQYDFNSDDFIPLSDYNYVFPDTHYPSPFSNGCVVTSPCGCFVYSFGNMIANDSVPNRIGIRYKIGNSRWSIISASSLNSNGGWIRHSMGCATDYIRNEVYLFGGLDSSDSPINTITTYNLDTFALRTLSSLQYPRSNPTIAVTEGNHILVIGGEGTSQLPIEYFDGNDNEILSYNPNGINNVLFDINPITLNISHFGTFLHENIVFVHQWRYRF